MYYIRACTETGAYVEIGVSAKLFLRLKSPLGGWRSAKRKGLLPEDCFAGSFSMEFFSWSCSVFWFSGFGI